MDADAVCAYMTQRGVEYSRKPIDHGEQIRARTGEIVNLFQTGRIVVQGKRSQLRDELEGWASSGFAPSTAASVSDDPQILPNTNGPSRDVFIVYGHDTNSRDLLELMLHKMDLHPIVLANLAAGGDTIIEKLERYLGQKGNVGFACVLLTPDDEGHRAGASDEKKYRARQNVILELGMVLARLGRKRVAILYKESVERPSDIDGLIYLGFRERVDEVKPILFRELKNAGYAPNDRAL